jgi:hypothetical protein
MHYWHSQFVDPMRVKASADGVVILEAKVFQNDHNVLRNI